MALWQERSADRIVSSPSAARVPNEVVVEGNATELWHDGEFMPMAIMPGMERIIYPCCTGSTWRGGEHRLHGKKLPGNYLGIITSENITDTTGLADQAWNPLDEYIYDVSNGWMDQKCQCSWEWEYQSEPIPPTCPRVWFPWSGWVDDGWFVSENVYFADDARYAVDATRSLSGGGWRVSGGWWVQDYGGGGPTQYGDSGANIYNAYGKPGDFGFGAVRGPARVDAAGCSRRSPSRPRARTGHRVRARWWTGCYIRGSTSIGVTPRRGVARPTELVGGGVERREEDVNGTWESEFVFFVHEQAETCVDVHAVSRSFTEEVRTRTHRTCRSAGGDGFAFVLRDDTDDAPGRESGARRSGTRDRTAAQLAWSSTRGTIHSMTSRMNGTWRCTPTAPSSTTRTTARVWGPPSTCPTLRTAKASRSRVVPPAGEAIAAAIESGDCKGSTARFAHFTRENPGLLRVFVDDMDVPR